MSPAKSHISAVFFLVKRYRLLLLTYRAYNEEPRWNRAVNVFPPSSSFFQTASSVHRGALSLLAFLLLLLCICKQNRVDVSLGHFSQPGVFFFPNKPSNPIVSMKNSDAPPHFLPFFFFCVSKAVMLRSRRLLPPSLPLGERFTGSMFAMKTRFYQLAATVDWYLAAMTEAAVRGFLSCSAASPLC